MEMTGFDVRIKETTCKEAVCMNCLSVGGCADAIRHIKNVLKKRFLGTMTHDQLTAELDRRFGPAKPEKQTPWEVIIEPERMIIEKIVSVAPESRPTTIGKLTEEVQEQYRQALERLNAHRWAGPYIKNGRLCFGSFWDRNQPEMTEDEVQAEELTEEELGQVALW